MTYQVEIGGRTRRVEVERGEGGVTVTVDGRRHAADVTVINGVYSLLLGDGGARRSFEVAVSEDPPASGNLTLHVNGRVVAAAVGTARGSWAQRGHDGAGAGGGPQRVSAPMPGKVVKVLVKPGDAVAPRQGVVVVEAMKMENELRAARAGTVAAVHAREGESVEAGTVLVVIE
jgi:biotin carboxyl carrier protein